MTHKGNRDSFTSPDGQWTEGNGSSRREIAFTGLLRGRSTPPAPDADIGSGEHWLIVAHQWAGKLDANTYATRMEGTKHLIASRKPGWRGWTTQQRGHTSARLRTIMALEEVLAELREARDQDFEDPVDDGALLGLLEASDPLPSGAGPREETVEVLRPRRATARPRRATSRPRRARRATPRPRRVRSEGRSPPARAHRRAGVATPTPRSRRR